MRHSRYARHPLVTIATASLLLFLGGAASPALGGGASKPAASPAAAHVTRVSPGTPRASHVFVIVAENTSLGQLTRKRAPYLVKTLKPKSGWLVGYRAVPHSSSTGDYIEMTSGQSIRCERNDSNPVNPNNDTYYGWSHILFCYVASEVTPSPTPSETASETPTPTPTQTVSESPTPMPTETETATPGPSVGATETQIPGASPSTTVLGEKFGHTGADVLRWIFIGLGMVLFGVAAYVISLRGAKSNS